MNLSTFLGAKKKCCAFSLLKQNLQLQAEQAGHAVGETTCKKSVEINVHGSPTAAEEPVYLAYAMYLLVLPTTENHKYCTNSTLV